MFGWRLHANARSLQDFAVIGKKLPGIGTRKDSLTNHEEVVKSKRRKGKSRNRKSNGVLHVGTITKEQIMAMDRRARRQLAIEAGAYNNAGAGSGVHGGTKKQRNKRNRQADRVELARGDLSE